METIPIIDWEYYSSHFPNIIPQKQFFAVERQAEVEYYKVIKPYMDISEERKQNTVFQLCNYLYSNRAVISGRAVTSVSNNGYSESYAVQTKEQAEDAMRELIYDCIGTRLAGVF
ncbi:MAG: hypothetical protein NC300_11435 [Bacteroidales bacterium]|nr:hypothetical protein [Clostridium sp.]MCM1204744.1 hypothetical protein [Bacteroidales bacterium]